MSANGKAPRGSDKGPASTKVDMAALGEHIGKTSARLEVVAKALKEYQGGSLKIPHAEAMERASEQLQALKSDIRTQHKEQETRVETVKSTIKTKLKGEVAKQMKTKVDEQIKAEILLQVKEQVSVQIREHLSLSIADVVAESKRQLVEVNHALRNSEARRANALLRSNNLDDNLAVVLKPDGSKSKLYPVNLRSLFAYDHTMTKELLKHHGLTCCEQREKNLNRFMSHIGIHFQLVALP